MFIGNFIQKIRKLNRKLCFISASDTAKPIGLYQYTDNNINHICGVDRGFIPEFIVYDKKGRIIKGGWRRVLMILLQKKLINKNKAEILFRTVLDGRKIKSIIEDSDVDRALKQAATPNDKGIEMKRDDLMDIAAMIRKERTHAC